MGGMWREGEGPSDSQVYVAEEESNKQEAAARPGAQPGIQVDPPPPGAAPAALVPKLEQKATLAGRKEKRRAYMRDLMRKKRAKEKARALEGKGRS